MNEYLIRTSDPGGYPKSNYRCRIHTGSLDTDAVLNILAEINPLRGGDSLIGAWDFDGNAIEPINQEDYDAIRPLGNEPSGQATKHLLYHHFAGALQRQLGSNHALYPDSNQPFEIEIRHKYFEGAWAGWGWRAEMVGDAGSRDPSVRAIGVYSDPECTEYQYTTGAFVQGPSDWQVDDADQPLTVWYTETPAGFAMEQKPDWHLAVLWASIQEGYQTLSQAAEAIRHNYWEQSQPAPQEAGLDWVDTGQTVTQLLGAGVFRVSGDSGIFVSGEPLRFGAQETEFVREHSPGIIVVSPHVSGAVGESIYRWQ